MGSVPVHSKRRQACSKGVMGFKAIIPTDMRPLAKEPRGKRASTKTVTCLRTTVARMVSKRLTYTRN